MAKYSKLHNSLIFQIFENALRQNILGSQLEYCTLLLCCFVLFSKKPNSLKTLLNKERANDEVKWRTY